MTRRRRRVASPDQAYWRIVEVANAMGQPWATVRDWLERAKVLVEVLPGVRLVSRAKLRSACHPDLWNTLCAEESRRAPKPVIRRKVNSGRSDGHGDSGPEHVLDPSEQDPNGQRLLDSEDDEPLADDNIATPDGCPA